MSQHLLVDHTLESLRARDRRRRALWQMTVAQRVAAMRRGELTLLGGEFEYLALLSPEVCE